MRRTTELAEHQKITVTYRVESGCLGPEGASLIEPFCAFAQQEVNTFATDVVKWKIVARTDKSQPEMQFSLMNKRISPAQARVYFQLLGKDFSLFEEEFVEFFYHVIECYMGRL